MTDRDRDRLVDYLTHILDAIERIAHYTEDMTEVTFLESPLVQDAVIRNIEVIGEASHNIDTRYPWFATKYPEIPLAVAYQMRNAMAHGYFKVDMEIVWRTLQHDLPYLGVDVGKILDQGKI